MKNTKIRMLGIAAIAAALVLIGLGLLLTLRSAEDEAPTMSPSSLSVNGEADDATACQTLMSAYFQAIVNQDGDALYKMMAPEEYWTYYRATYHKTIDDIVATYNDAIQNTLSSWETACGEHVKVSFQIEASSEQSQEFLDEWSSSMNALIGKEAFFQAQTAMTLQITQTVTGTAGSQESVILPTLIKVNGTWYILDEGASTEP